MSALTCIQWYLCLRADQCQDPVRHDGVEHTAEDSVIDYLMGRKQASLVLFNVLP